MPLGDHGACRLCWHQALHERSTGEPFDLADANRFGQQLFLANMHYQPRGATRAKHHRRFRASAVARGITRVETEFTPVDSQQLALFWIRPDLTRIATLPAAPDPAMSHYCDAVLHEHAARHGWSTRLINVVGQSLDVLQAFQATSGAKIVASEAASLLTQRGLTVDSTLEVLAAANLLDDDRIPGTRNHFLVKTERLPATMRTQLDTWYTVMAEGSTTPPRRKPRNHKTIRAQLNGMLPILQKWADAGHDSLAEIDKDDVVTALPESGPARQVAHQGLRSLFRILKARKVVFINPTTGVPAGPQGQTLPLPVDTAVICDALNAPHPARALAVALVAFHGLTARQISTIRLTDVGDGRLRLDGRSIPLAGPVQARLTAYLDFREQRWPTTTNPYLIVNRRSAPRVDPVDHRYPWHRYPLGPRSLREDRILHEIHATGGDVRRICDLFGLSITAAMRYNAVLEHPDLANDNAGC
ncbi:hypothetical protein [Saccharopolyspora sp. NPDC049426]|uniref:hypothetical protein n=1 Tax=Saccharopolyspora sp. NPDC049426 TaxID=3155652 RepID=UPI00343639CC